jgi:uncharacterized membrane protein HdeD (DUF308 family)
MSVQVPTSPVSPPDDLRASLGRRWWLLLALGVVSVIIGILAIAYPEIATWKVVLVIGILLVVAGVAEIVHAVLMRNLRGFALHLLGAALYLIVGLFILEDPDRAAVVLTLLLAAAFFVGGVLRIVFSCIDQLPAWPWVLLNGVVNIALGVLIWRGWPDTSEWVIGLFVGIDLLFNGWSWIMLALAVRSSSPAAPA